jgi:Na+/proline symporter
MRARLAGTVMLSTVVFFVVTLFVSVGVLWWTGDATRGVRIGVICGAIAVFTVRAVSWAGRSGERSSNEHRRSRDGYDR